MKDVVFVTGNAKKAQYFSAMVGIDIAHEAADIEELQDLDLDKVIEHKARATYALLRRPVIVEDTQVTFHALGRLPGTFIKWFMDELGPDGLCAILDAYNDRSATAGAAIAYFDGLEMRIFKGGMLGSITQKPMGDNGFGWNAIFIPDGSTQTLGQMTDADFKKYYAQIKPFNDFVDFAKIKSSKT